MLRTLATVLSIFTLCQSGIAAAEWVSNSLYMCCRGVLIIPLRQPFDVTTLRAPDGSVTAKFVSFGATMTELWVKDKFGRSRDVILGYDDNVS